MNRLGALLAIISASMHPTLSIALAQGMDGCKATAGGSRPGGIGVLTTELSAAPGEKTINFAFALQKVHRNTNS